MLTSFEINTGRLLFRYFSTFLLLQQNHSIELIQAVLLQIFVKFERTYGINILFQINEMQYPVQMAQISTK